MPKGSNEQEKQLIMEALIEQGKSLFSTYGLKKTSMSDITKAVGIAQGSFYLFYHSKEELYFEIIEKEEEKIKAQFLHADLFKDGQPREAIKGLLLRTLEEIESNPLLRQLYFEGNMEALVRKLPKEKLETHQKNDSLAILPLIEKWQGAEILIDKNPEVIAGIFRSLFMLTLHKKEIGEANYHETMKLLIDLIVDGMMKEG